ncbi:MAG: hypothetical protein ABEJ70_06580 [Halobacteriaceae archaeon]
MHCDCQTDHRDGVTLVTCVVHGDDRPRRVHVANRLDGPVHPPRRGGRPVPGWDASGYRGVVPADGTLALGYATPAPPADPPAELAWSGPAEATETGPADVLRDLGDPRPPRDAVATADRVRTPPDPVTAWLDDVRRRVDAGETGDRAALETVGERVARLRDAVRR